VELQEAVLEPATSAEQVPVAVHVTSESRCGPGPSRRASPHAAVQRFSSGERPPCARVLPPARSWEAIQASGHLLRMKRTHVHFATAPHHLRRNTWADVLLRLDLKAGVGAGYEVSCRFPWG
jgi:hypothetical protein